MRDRLARIGPAVVLLIFPVSIVVRAGLTHSTLDYDDLQYQFYPWQQMLHGLQASGTWFPLWNPYEFAGMPMFADVQKQMLYPPSLLFRVLPPAAAVPCFVALHLALAGGFVYRLLRRLEHSRAGALVGGLTYATSSFCVLHASQLTVLAGACWLPAGCLSIERLRCQPGKGREVALAALYGAHALLAGSPQMLFISLWGWLAWLAWRRPPPGRCLAAAGLAGLLALPQLLAAAELLGHAWRGAAQDFAFVSDTSYPPWRWWTVLAPYAYGNPAVTPDKSYSFHEITWYLGCGSLLLAAHALWHRQPQRDMWLGLVLVSIAVALGSYTPILRVLVDWLPGFSWFRVPGRWLLLATLGAAGLAASGFDSLRRRGWRGWAPVLGVVAVGLWGFYLLTVHGGQGLALPLAFWLAMAAATAVLVRWPRLGTMLVLALVVAELDLFAAQYVRFTSVSEVGTRTALLTELPPWPTSGRGITVSDKDASSSYLLSAMAYRLSEVQGSNPLVMAETLEYLFTAATRHLLTAKAGTSIISHDGAFRMPVDAYNHMMAMLNVGWAVRVGPTGERLQTVPGGYGAGWLVGQSRLSERVGADMQLADEDVDPRQMALLEAPYPQAVPATAPTGLSPVRPGGRAETRDTGLSPVRPGGRAETRDLGHVDYARYQCDHVEYDVSTSDDAYLLLSEVYYPGWQATVDGHAVLVVRADGLLRALRVPRGWHHVVLSYRPWWRWTFPLPPLVLAGLVGVEVSRDRHGIRQ